MGVFEIAYKLLLDKYIEEKKRIETLFIDATRRRRL